MGKERGNYATFSDGLSYREISEIMTNDGNEMNVTTARHHFITGCAKLIQSISAHYGKKITFEEAKEKAGNVDAQEGLKAMLEEIYYNK